MFLLFLLLPLLLHVLPLTYSQSTPELLYNTINDGLPPSYINRITRNSSASSIPYNDTLLLHSLWNIPSRTDINSKAILVLQPSTYFYLTSFTAIIKATVAKALTFNCRITKGPTTGWTELGLNNNPIIVNLTNYNISSTRSTVLAITCDFVSSSRPLGVYINSAEVGLSVWSSETGTPQTTFWLSRNGPLPRKIIPYIDRYALVGTTYTAQNELSGSSLSTAIYGYIAPYSMIDNSNSLTQYSTFSSTPVNSLTTSTQSFLFTINPLVSAPLPFFTYPDDSFSSTITEDINTYYTLTTFSLILNATTSSTLFTANITGILSLELWLTTPNSTITNLYNGPIYIPYTKHPLSSTILKNISVIPKTPTRIDLTIFPQGILSLFPYWPPLQAGVTYALLVSFIPDSYLPGNINLYWQYSKQGLTNVNEATSRTIWNIRPSNYLLSNTNNWITLLPSQTGSALLTAKNIAYINIIDTSEGLTRIRTNTSVSIPSNTKSLGFTFTIEETMVRLTTLWLVGTCTIGNNLTITVDLTLFQADSSTSLPYASPHETCGRVYEIITC